VGAILVSPRRLKNDAHQPKELMGIRDASQLSWGFRATSGLCVSFLGGNSICGLSGRQPTHRGAIGSYYRYAEELSRGIVSAQLRRWSCSRCLSLSFIPAVRGARDDFFNGLLDLDRGLRYNLG
jgi:hypothetical protein